MMVSVCMITYNHEKFIREAIEGVLMQQTDFDFELVIGEDCSSDNTRGICIEYQNQYPEKIKLLLPGKNLGMMPNFKATIQSCTGKYIALCEGDDYWTDPLKLQKQVNFLEENEAFSGVFHNVFIFDGVKGIIEGQTTNKEGQCGFNDVLRNNVVPTLSLVFRNNVKFPEWFLNMKIGDWYLHLLNLENKPYYCFNEILGVYRKTSVGMFSGKNKIQKILIRIDFYKNVMKYFNGKQVSKICKNNISSLYFQLAKFEQKTTSKSYLLLKSFFYNPKQVRNIVKYWLS